MPLNLTKPNSIYLIYMYEKDLALNNLQWLIYHKTKRNQTSTEPTTIYIWARFFNILAWKSPELVDMPLKSLNRSIIYILYYIETDSSEITTQKM